MLDAEKNDVKQYAELSTEILEREREIVQLRSERVKHSPATSRAVRRDKPLVVSIRNDTELVILYKRDNDSVVEVSPTDEVI